MAFWRWVEEVRVNKPPTMVRLFMAAVMAFFLSPFILATCFVVLQIGMALLKNFERFKNIDTININYLFLIHGIPAILLATWLIAFDEASDFLIWAKLPLYHEDMHGPPEEAFIYPPIPRKLPPEEDLPKIKIQPRPNPAPSSDPHAAFKPPRR